MENIQHSGSFARCLRPESTEKPIEAIAVSKLGAVRVISFYDSGKKLVEIARNLIPGLAAFVPGKCDKKSLGGDHVYLVYRFEYQIQDSLFLEQVLPVSQCPQFILLLLVF